MKCKVWIPNWANNDLLLHLLNNVQAQSCRPMDTDKKFLVKQLVYIQNNMTSNLQILFYYFKGSNSGGTANNTTVVQNETRMSGISPFHSAEHFLGPQGDMSLSYHTCEECSATNCVHGSSCDKENNHLFTPSPLSRSKYVCI